MSIFTNYLTKDERSKVNRRAHYLATRLQNQAYEAYRFRLTEWATQQKFSGVLDPEDIEMQEPDISDILEGGF